jgi:hypothetical protein
MTSELVHVSAELAADFHGQQIAMKLFSRQRPRHSAVRANQAQVDAEFAGNRKRELMPPPGRHYDFHTHLAGPPYRRDIVL